jgi:acyl-coenzyme A thioesterase PaaI-like protein
MKLKNLLTTFVEPKVRSVLGEARMESYKLKAFGLLKIPMIFMIQPEVVELSGRRVAIRIPLNRFNRNHLGSMYFGVLCAAADCAGGVLAMKLIEEGGGGVNLVFKDFHAEFLKRVEGDALFVCEDGEKTEALVARARESEARVEDTVSVFAYVPSQSDSEPVARFKLTLSLKKAKSTGA